MAGKDFMMNHSDFLKAIKDNTVKGIYFLFGREDYLIDSAMKRLKNSLNQAMVDFNYTIIDGQNTNVADISSNIATLPFMDEKRIIVVKDFELLKDKRKNFSEKDEKLFIENLEMMPDTTILVFVNDFEKADARKKFYKYIAGNGRIIDCNKVSDDNLMKWVGMKFNQKHVYIDNYAISSFIELKGYRDRNSKITLNDLSSEIDRIASFVGRGNTATKEIIEEASIKKIENNIFRLIDCFIGKKPSEAMRLFNDMLDDGENIFGIFSMLSRQLKLIVDLRVDKDNGIKYQDCAKARKMNSFAVKQIYRQCGLVSDDMARNVIKYLSDADYRIKTGRIDDRLSFEILIAEYCS